MDPKINEKNPHQKLSPPIITRGRAPLPEGFWSTPGQHGFQGTVTGIHKAIDELKDVPDHWKRAMKAGIDAEVARTGGNFVELHAHAQRGDNDLHVTIHVKTSKKSI